MGEAIFWLAVIVVIVMFVGGTVGGVGASFVLQSQGQCSIDVKTVTGGALQLPSNQCTEMVGDWVFGKPPEAPWNK